VSAPCPCPEPKCYPQSRGLPTDAHAGAAVPAIIKAETKSAEGSVPPKEGAESGGVGDAKKRKKRGGASEVGKELGGEKSGEGGRSTPVGGVAGEKKRGRKGTDKDKNKDGDATKEVKDITAVAAAVEVKSTVPLPCEDRAKSPSFSPDSQRVFLFGSCAAGFVVCYIVCSFPGLMFRACFALVGAVLERRTLNPKP
jgi:hypothetical protein